MFSPERSARILALESLRKSRIITLITSVRPGLIAQMADEQVRVMYDHLLKLRGKEDRIDRLDLYIMSNGGESLVPWRIISVFREFAKHIGVLVPYRAYSAATLTALGADEIVMGPFAQLGPIDPTVQNDFNPMDERTNQKIGVSVEDVKSYIQFIKNTVGITHEDELIRAIEALLQKVHPLALGNVERFIQQSRMIARKLLKTHMSEDSDKHAIDEIIENMASKLYFHGHPISRQEARDDLRLKTVAKPNRAIDDALWALYNDYEGMFDMNDALNPPGELAKLRIAAGGLQGNYEPAYNAALAAGANQVQAIQLALQHAQAMVSTPIVYEMDLPVAAIETADLSAVYTVKQRWEILPEIAPGQMTMRSEILEQRWSRSERPASSQTAANLTQAATVTPAQQAP